MKTLITVTLAGLSIALAPVAGADADDLTNVEVAGSQSAEGGFERFDTGLELIEGTGGQGSWDFYQDFDNDPNTPDTFSFDTGQP